MRIQFKVIGIKLIFISFVIILTGCAEDKALKKRQSQAKVDLAKSLLAQGNLTAGLNELLQAVELDPKNPETQNELALAYREMNIYSHAITHFKKAIELKADILLVSQTVTQKNIHVKNLTNLVELLEAEGIRDQVILICGGARISNELAKELGYDSGFGPGTYAEIVATFAIKELMRRKSLE